MAMTRTEGIGYGTKSDFTTNKYNRAEFISIKRDFDEGNQRGLKYSFGLGDIVFKKHIVLEIKKNKILKK